jgi:aminotransferase
MPRERSSRLSGLDSSDIIKMRRECERLGAINLASGTCELPTPSPLMARATEAITAGRNVYSFPEGVPELRKAIAHKLARDNDIIADPDAEIAITVGATGAFAATLMALLDPADGVLLLEPFYGWHRNAILVAGCIPEFVTLDAPAFRLDADKLSSAISDRTRAIVVCTPSNPTGRVYDEGELEVVSRVAAERNLLVITDEVYEYLVYDGRTHRSPRAMPSLLDRTVSIMGLSKTFNVTGWRIGYVVASAARLRSICTAHDFFYTCAPTPLQHAAVAGLELPPDYYLELKSSYQSRRDQLLDALHRAGMEPLCPEGAYYILAGFSRLGVETSSEAVRELLERTRVACVPGRAFYTSASHDRFLRFCFARPKEEIAEACARLARL